MYIHIQYYFSICSCCNLQRTKTYIILTRMIHSCCDLVMFLFSTFSTSSFPLKLSCKNNPVTVKTYQLSSNKNISPSDEQWDEPKTKSSEEWRAPRRAGRVSATCLGSGSFPQTRRWGPRRVDVLRWRLFPVSDGERGAADGNSAFFCFSGRKDTRRGCECLACLQKWCRFFPRAEGRCCQDTCCQNTHKSTIDLCSVSTLLQWCILDWREAKQHKSL